MLHHTEKKNETVVSEATKKRENTILAILLSGDKGIYNIISNNIKVSDFKYDINTRIAKRLYEEFESGNSNINSIIDKLSEDEQNHITSIMAEDYGLENLEKAIDDIIQAYEKEKLNERKLEILELLEKENGTENKKELEKELSDIIIRLAKIR